MKQRIFPDGDFAPPWLSIEVLLLCISKWCLDLIVPSWIFPISRALFLKPDFIQSFLGGKTLSETELFHMQRGKNASLWVFLSPKSKVLVLFSDWQTLPHPFYGMALFSYSICPFFGGIDWLMSLLLNVLSWRRGGQSSSITERQRDRKTGRQTETESAHLENSQSGSSIASKYGTKEKPPPEVPSQ